MYYDSYRVLLNTEKFMKLIVLWHNFKTKKIKLLVVLFNNANTER